MNRTEPVAIGRYKGFDLQIAYFAMDKMYLAYLVGSGINPVQLGADASATPCVWTTACTTCRRA